MKILFLGFCFLWLSGTRVQSKPQITKLFPVQELVDYHQQASNEVKPLDKFLGKLRATYNFVFRKPENTSNVEKILAKDSPDPDLESLKFIWSNQMQRNSKDDSAAVGSNAPSLGNGRTLSITGDDWINDIQPVERLEPLELQDEVENKDKEVEAVTPRTGLQLPVTLSRHLVEWLGSLLGLTYGVYSKLARAIHGDPAVNEDRL